MKSILIVEDSDTLRLLYKNKFKEYDYREARNGEEALFMVNERCPDLVITDLNMPVMDGITFLRKSKKGFVTMIVTDYPRLLDTEELTEMHVEKYLIKHETQLKDVVAMAKAILDRV